MIHLHLPTSPQCGVVGSRTNANKAPVPRRASMTRRRKRRRRNARREKRRAGRKRTSIPVDKRRVTYSRIRHNMLYLNVMRIQAPAADFDEEEEEDMRTRQLRRAMAGVDVFAPSEYEPSSADVSQAPVDFLTGDVRDVRLSTLLSHDALGQNANVISTNWVSDMDFSRAQPPEADASAFFQTSTSDGLGTVEQDGYNMCLHVLPMHNVNHLVRSRQVCIRRRP